MEQKERTTNKPSIKKEEHKKQNKNFYLIFSNSEIGSGANKKYFESFTELQKAYCKETKHFKYVKAFIYKGYDKENNIHIYDYVNFD